MLWTVGVLALVLGSDIVVSVGVRDLVGNGFGLVLWPSAATGFARFPDLGRKWELTASILHVWPGETVNNADSWIKGPRGTWPSRCQQSLQVFLTQSSLLPRGATSRGISVQMSGLKKSTKSSSQRRLIILPFVPGTRANRTAFCSSMGISSLFHLMPTMVQMGTVSPGELTLYPAPRLIISKLNSTDWSPNLLYLMDSTEATATVELTGISEKMEVWTVHQEKWGTRV